MTHTFVRRGSIGAWLPVAAVLALAAFGQRARSAQISVDAVAEVRSLDELIRPLCSELSLPGLAAAVVGGGVVRARGDVGVRRAGHAEPIGPDDLWHLGSCTKAMTATLIARLVEAGHLRFDQPVLEVLKDVAKGLDEEARERWSGLTLDLLIQNRSGMGSPHDDRALWAELWERRGTPTEQRARLAAAMLASPPPATLGSYLYSNANCAIAGHVAEVVLGRPYEALMEEFVFAPLGMSTAGFDVPWDHDLAADAPATQPWPHAANGRPLTPGPRVDNPPSIAPAGTVHASLADWSRFVALHLAGARGTATDFLTTASFAHLHEAVPIDTQSGYAAGWIVLDRAWARGSEEGAHGRCLTHTGSNNSWFAVVWIAPEQDLAVLVTTNQGGGDVGRHVDRVAWAVIQDALAH